MDALLPLQTLKWIGLVETARQIVGQTRLPQSEGRGRTDLASWTLGQWIESMVLVL